ncbi:MAG: efflux RND transporter periplasmic adaptor subunit [Candidatus Kapaibacterium sp.]
MNNSTFKSKSGWSGRVALIVVVGLLIAVGGVAAGYFLLPSFVGMAGHNHADETIYFCPMHPQVRQNEPGVCPICHMDLVPENNPDGMSEQMEGGENLVHITPRQRLIADVATVEVDYRQLQSDITAPATVGVNEETQKVVTAWFPGRIEKLYVQKTGDYVRKGSPLALIYSPELVTAQKEYLLALDARDRQLLPTIERRGERSAPNEGENRLVVASEERLKLLGMTDGQIQGLRERGEIARTTTIFSTASGIVTRRSVVEGAYVNEGTTLIEVVDLSAVWVIANVSESQANLIRPGMIMSVTGLSLNGKVMNGRVEYIYPMVDPESRTIQVRGVFANPNLQLKPGTYLTASLTHSATDALAVPVGAVIRTGERDLVYVESGEHTFEAREVTLGMKSNGYYQIVAGNINRGDKVVAEGGYLLDSERELSGGSSGGEHQH